MKFQSRGRFLGVGYYACTNVFVRNVLFQSRGRFLGVGYQIPDYRKLP